MSTRPNPIPLRPDPAAARRRAGDSFVRAAFATAAGRAPRRVFLNRDLSKKVVKRFLIRVEGDGLNRCR